MATGKDPDSFLLEGILQNGDTSIEKKMLHSLIDVFKHLGRVAQLV